MINPSEMTKLSFAVAQNYCDACQCKGRFDIATALKEMIDTCAAGITASIDEHATIATLESLIAHIKSQPKKGETVQ